ncbi:MAG: ABC transporter ATP-binding protein [Anaerolineae bacterium]
MATVRMVNLSKYFGKVCAVRDLNLAAQDKRFLTLLGPSGCGKTTILNMVAGLESPTQGQIWLDETMINKVPPAHRDIAMVFQSYALYPHMNVYDNMAFALRMRGERETVIEKRVKEVATMLGIAELLRRRPRELSGGQRQRVALGRACVRDPKVFLLDEPLSNLDAALRLQMRAELKLLFERLQGTVIYVTHDQSEAMTMSDTIAVLKDGVLQQIGSPLEIYYKPRNLFVAGFVGSPSINLVSCVLIQENGKLFAESANWRLSLAEAPASQQLQPWVGRKVVLGIRPESLSLDTPDSENSGVISGRAIVVEHLGSETVVLVETGSHLLTMVVQGSAAVRSGENLAVRVDQRSIYVFCFETEEALATPEPDIPAG